MSDVDEPWWPSQLGPVHQHGRRTHFTDTKRREALAMVPSSSAVNPAPTAMANAMRVGDHPMERLGVSRPDAVVPQQATGGDVRIGVSR